MNRQNENPPFNASSVSVGAGSILGSRILSRVMVEPFNRNIINRAGLHSYNRSGLSARPNRMQRKLIKTFKKKHNLDIPVISKKNHNAMYTDMDIDINPRTGNINRVGQLSGSKKVYTGDMRKRFGTFAALHELGHAKDFRNTSVLKAGIKKSVLPFAAAAAMSMSDNETLNNYAPLALATGGALTLKDEITATSHAYNHLKRYLGKNEARRHILSNGVPALATYVALGAAPALVLYAANKLRQKFRNKTNTS